MPGHRRIAAAAGHWAADAAGAGAAGYQLIDSTIPGQMDKSETSLFDGIDTSLSALASMPDRIRRRR